MGLHSSQCQQSNSAFRNISAYQSQVTHLCGLLLVKDDFFPCSCAPDLVSEGGLSHASARSPPLSEFGGAEQSPLVQTHPITRGSPSPTHVLHDLQQSDSTSYVLLNLAKGTGSALPQSLLSD